MSNHSPRGRGDASCERTGHSRTRVGRHRNSCKMRKTRRSLTRFPLSAAVSPRGRGAGTAQAGPGARPRAVPVPDGSGSRRRPRRAGAAPDRRGRGAGSARTTAPTCRRRRPRSSRHRRGPRGIAGDVPVGPDHPRGRGRALALLRVGERAEDVLPGVRVVEHVDGEGGSLPGSRGSGRSCRRARRRTSRPRSGPRSSSSRRATWAPPQAQRARRARRRREAGQETGKGVWHEHLDERAGRVFPSAVGRRSGKGKRCVRRGSFQPARPLRPRDGPC